MEKLKPCPFCGGKAEIICSPDYFRTTWGWLVKCKKGCCNQMPFQSEHSAVEAWNTRHEAKEKK